MRNHPPRDAIAATDLWVPVDATGEDFYALGQRFGTQVGVLHEVHAATGHPYATRDGAGFFDPWALRWHRLQRRTSQDLEDNRLAFQVVNDYEAPYEDVRPGDAPFGQAELFTSLNRTTREADQQGRVALPSSHRRIIDSEDDRYALALTCRRVPLGTADAPDVPVVDDLDEAGLPEGIAFHEAGTESDSHGSLTRTQPSVSIGGVTYFGDAAIDAAKAALAAGGSLADAARWASAAARNVPRPPLLDAPTNGGSTRERARPPEPDRNPAGSVPLLDHPAGYVWSLAGRVGLLGTLVCPEGAAGHYFVGREGTPIGPLPLRHDAQVTMGPDIVGRVVFVRDDAALIAEGRGKPIKGELWQDTSRANQDTELGHETTQWRPVIRVDADLPPSKPPPQDPPPWLPPEDEDGPEDTTEDDDEEGGRRPGGRRNGPSGSGGAGGAGAGDPDPPTTIGVLPGGGTLVRPRQPEHGGDDELAPVTDPHSQRRDYERPGVPCPNATAGVFVATGLLEPTLPGRGVGRPHRVPGGWIQYSGHPALTRVAGGLLVGGEEAPLPLGLPAPLGGGVVVDPAPNNGVPRGAPGPNDDPGRIPLGLPVGNTPGLGYEPPLGGDRGVPRGAGERAEQRERQERARRAREEAERREQQQLDKLKELEQQAREAGRSRRGDRIKRARERMERRRAEREERRRRREEYKERKRREQEERRRRREERRAERRRRQLEERARRSRQRDDREAARRRSRPTLPQGGYLIDVTDAGAEAESTGRLTERERRQLEEDRARERDAPDSPFGHWNVANRPIPFLGASGGPRSLEGWAHLTTFAVRALQRVAGGAFGGPGYLAANLGVVHRNAPGNPPVGSRLGAHWTPLPDEPTLEVCDEPVVEVVSVLDAPAGKNVRACGGAVLRVAREHRGEGFVDDDRPLVLLDDARAHSSGDLVRDVRGVFRVDAARGVTATRVIVRVPCDQRGPALEVVRACEGRAPERVVAVEQDGVLAAAGGARVGRALVLEPGAVLELQGAQGLPAARLTLSELGLVLSVGHGELERRLVFGPEGLLVQGDVVLTGKVRQG